MAHRFESAKQHFIQSVFLRSFRFDSTTAVISGQLRKIYLVGRSLNEKQDKGALSGQPDTLITFTMFFFLNILNAYKSQQSERSQIKREDEFLIQVCVSAEVLPFVGGDVSVAVENVSNI